VILKVYAGVIRATRIAGGCRLRTGGREHHTINQKQGGKEMKKIWPSLMVLAALTLMAACASTPKEIKPAAAAAPAADQAAAAPRKVQLLFVQNADRVVIKDKHTITLEGVSPATIFFSDRPDRITGHMLTPHFVKLWSKGSDNFATSPPNATISVLSGKTNGMRSFVVELSNPRLTGHSLSYDVKLLQGKVLATSAGPCTLFIDALSEPLASDSYADVNRRVYRRGDDGTVVYEDDDGADNGGVWSDDDTAEHVWNDDKDDTEHIWNDEKDDTEHNWNRRK
jgi:hypothetical protein